MMVSHKAVGKPIEYPLCSMRECINWQNPAAKMSLRPMFSMAIFNSMFR